MCSRPHLPGKMYQQNPKAAKFAGFVNINQPSLVACHMSWTACSCHSRPVTQSTIVGSLAGAFTFIWAAAVLHVLSKAECARFVTNIYSLLSEGGSLYGWTLGRKQAGATGKTPDGKQDRWAHSLVSTLYLYLHSGSWAANSQPC